MQILLNFRESTSNFHYIHKPLRGLAFTRRLLFHAPHNNVVLHVYHQSLLLHFVFFEHALIIFISSKHFSFNLEIFLVIF